MNWKVLVLSVVVIGGVLAAGGGVYWWKNRNAGAPNPFANFEPPQAVQVVEAKTASWRPTATMVGTVFAIRSVTVSNEVAGTVKEVNFDSGSVAEHGDPLLTLDTSTEEADLKAAEAAIKVSEAGKAMAESTLQLAESNMRRVSEAAARNAIAAMESDKAKSEVDAMKANLDKMNAEMSQARAKADQVRSIIEKKHIHAPFKGRAGIRTVHPGQYLKEGSEVVSLQGIDDQVYLDFALPQEEAWRVHPGETFMITSALLGKDPVPIKVQAMDAQVNMATRNVRIRSIVANKNDALRPGMSVEVNVPIGEAREYVVVPSVAVRRATYGDHVFVVGPSQKPGEGPDKQRATQRFVKLGPSLGQNVIVLDGLKPGEQVAAEGSFKLHDGALVAVPPAGSPPAPADAGAPASAAAPTKPNRD